jgi:hypothetical protein
LTRFRPSLEFRRARMALDCPYLDLTPHWAYGVDRHNIFKLE